MISERQYMVCAQLLKVETEAVKAVAAVESKGSGFLPDGKPKILFESHIFWKELRKRGIDPNRHTKGNSDILYPVWTPGKYGPESKQHERMERASKIHREAALCAASWGKFQILGTNWQLCDYESLQDFINAMYQSEDEHLQAFTCYIKNTGLDDELRAKDWKGFARVYNGPAYWKNRYDAKLKAAYLKHKS